MRNTESRGTNIVDFSSAKAVKDFIDEANDHIFRLENALYDIMDAKDIQITKEIAADALDEDLDVYLEEDDLTELDFDDDGNLPWDDIKDEDNQ